MMKRMFRKAVLLSLLLALSATGIQAQEIFGKSRNIDRERMSEVYKLLKERVDRGDFAGGMLLVKQNGQDLYTASYGKASETKNSWKTNTLARIFSMTKPITAVGIMILVDEGKLLLNDDLAKYLPEFSEMEVIETFGPPTLTAEAKRPIKVRDLLTHTAGFTYSFIPSPIGSEYTRLGINPGDNNTPEGKVQTSIASMVRELSNLPLLFNPGEAYHYSVGLDVAGRLIEVVTGIKLDRFFKDKIFTPLGMVDTGFYADTDDQILRLSALYSPTQNGLLPIDAGIRSVWATKPLVLSGGGGLVSTPRDYQIFSEMLLNKGVSPGRDGTRILSTNAAELVMQNHFSQAYGESDSPFATSDVGEAYGMGHALGGWVVTDRIVAGVPQSNGTYFWGGYAATFFWVDPEKDLSVVFFTQLAEDITAVGVPRKIDYLRPRIANLIYSALED